MEGQTRIGGMHFGLETGIGPARLVFGQDFGFDMVRDAPHQRVRVAIGQRAIFPGQLAFARQHIHGRAARDHIGLQRRIGRIEARIAIVLQLFAQRFADRQ